MREPMLVLDENDRFVTFKRGVGPTVWAVGSNGTPTPLTDRRKNTLDLPTLLTDHWPLFTGTPTVIACKCGVRSEAETTSEAEFDAVLAGRAAHAEHVAEVIRDAVNVAGRDADA